MIKFVKGDVTTSKADALLHSVNCKGLFSAGFAGVIQKKYPIARAFYMEDFYNGLWHLGRIQVVRSDVTDYPWSIVNGAGQFEPGRNGDKMGIWAILYQYRELLRKEGWAGATIEVGCGIAGLSFENDVKPMMEKLFKDDKEVSLEVWSL